MLSFEKLLMCGAYLLLDTIWYGHILHWNQFCQVCQAEHILDFLSKFGAVKRSKQNQNVIGEDLHFIILATLIISYLMKGFVSASRVRINQEGWTIIKDFKFFRNLDKKSERRRQQLNPI